MVYTRRYPSGVKPQGSREEVEIYPDVGGFISPADYTIADRSQFVSDWVRDQWFYLHGVSFRDIANQLRFDEFKKRFAGIITKGPIYKLALNKLLAVLFAGDNRFDINATYYSEAFLKAMFDQIMECRTYVEDYPSSSMTADEEIQTIEFGIRHAMMLIRDPSLAEFFRNIVSTFHSLPEEQRKQPYDIIKLLQDEQFQTAVQVLLTSDPNLTLEFDKNDFVNRTLEALVGHPHSRWLNQAYPDLSAYDVWMLINSQHKGLLGFFNQAAHHAVVDKHVPAQLLMQWIKHELFQALHETDIPLAQSQVSPQQLGELVKLVATQQIPVTLAKTFFRTMWNYGDDVNDLFNFYQDVVNLSKLNAEKVADWLQTEIFSVLVTRNLGFQQFPIIAIRVAKYLRHIQEKAVPESNAKIIFEAIWNQADYAIEVEKLFADIEAQAVGESAWEKAWDEFFKLVTRRSLPFGKPLLNTLKIDEYQQALQDKRLTLDNIKQLIYLQFEKNRHKIDIIIAIAARQKVNLDPYSLSLFIDNTALLEFFEIVVAQTNATPAHVFVWIKQMSLANSQISKQQLVTFLRYLQKNTFPDELAQALFTELCARNNAADINENDLDDLYSKHHINPWRDYFAEVRANWRGFYPHPDNYTSLQIIDANAALDSELLNLLNRLSSALHNNSLSLMKNYISALQLSKLLWHVKEHTINDEEMANLFAAIANQQQDIFHIIHSYDAQRAEVRFINEAIEVQEEMSAADIEAAVLAIEQEFRNTINFFRGQHPVDGMVVEDILRQYLINYLPEEHREKFLQFLFEYMHQGAIYGSMKERFYTIAQQRHEGRLQINPNSSFKNTRVELFVRGDEIDIIEKCSLRHLLKSEDMDQFGTPGNFTIIQNQYGPLLDAETKHTLWLDKKTNRVKMRISAAMITSYNKQALNLLFSRELINAFYHHKEKLLRLHGVASAFLERGHVTRNIQAIYQDYPEIAAWNGFEAEGFIASQSPLQHLNYQGSKIFAYLNEIDPEFAYGFVSHVNLYGQNKDVIRFTRVIQLLCMLRREDLAQDILKVVDVHSFDESQVILAFNRYHDTSYHRTALILQAEEKQKQQPLLQDFAENFVETGRLDINQINLILRYYPELRDKTTLLDTINPFAQHDIVPVAKRIFQHLNFCEPHYAESVFSCFNDFFEHGKEKFVNAIDLLINMGREDLAKDVLSEVDVYSLEDAEVITAFYRYREKHKPNRMLEAFAEGFIETGIHDLESIQELLLDYPDFKVKTVSSINLFGAGPGINLQATSNRLLRHLNYTKPDFALEIFYRIEEYHAAGKNQFMNAIRLLATMGREDLALKVLQFTGVAMNQYVTDYVKFDQAYDNVNQQRLSFANLYQKMTDDYLPTEESVAAANSEVEAKEELTVASASAPLTITSPVHVDDKAYIETKLDPQQVAISHSDSFYQSNAMQRLFLSSKGLLPEQQPVVEEKRSLFSFLSRRN